MIARILKAKDMIVVGTPRAARYAYLYLLAVSGLLTQAAPEKPQPLVQIQGLR